jgi:hypothetical protein
MPRSTNASGARQIALIEQICQRLVITSLCSCPGTQLVRFAVSTRAAESAEFRKELPVQNPNVGIYFTTSITRIVE